MRRSDRLCAVRNAAVMLIALAIAAGCATQGPRPSETVPAAPANFPVQYYRDAVAKGEPVYRIDPAQSLLVIEVHRSGSLARLGHDHVVASHDIRGLVAPDAGRADLYVELNRLVVDEPSLRSEAGFDTQPSDDDIAGTRRNMLNELQTDQYPFARISVSAIGTGDARSQFKVAVTLREATREFEAPVQIQSSTEAISVKGNLSLRQTDFGLNPLSVLGGAIQVQDQIDLRFRIRATRIWRADDA
ncbi:MAG TPA: YceI family protein [Casimicrobiaceae bacterium]|nr:YceI family protein [Casimicrobiaceae bacterium]